jgi:hypothetical protein
MSTDIDKEIEQFIEDSFYDNLAVVETENQLRVSSFVKEQALLQVKLYWQKLKDLAQKVTESEVPVTLSNQKTPKDRTFTINGVVDIIKEDQETVLYDIKTHDPDFVNHNKKSYEQQLNIYGSIWEKVNQAQLDKTAVIATPLPAKLRWALKEGSPAQIENAIHQWQPVIDLEYNQLNCKETLEEFGRIVDSIQDSDFTPPSVDELNTKLEGTKRKFAVKICRNCDIRFACDSYREYSTGRRTLSSDDLLYLIKDMGDDKDHLVFKNVSFEADVEKEFEASTEEINTITENEIDEEKENSYNEYNHTEETE